jgi:transposase
MLFRRGAAYSQDLRERVFAIADGGVSVTQTARLLMVSVSYVSKVLSRRRVAGERSAKPQVCHVPPKLLGLRTSLAAKVAEVPDATLAELRAWLLATHGVSASDALLHRELGLLGVTYKKSPSGQRNRTVPTLPPPGRTGARVRAR